MSDEIIKILASMRFKHRSDSLKNWNANNPILLSGEVGVVTGLNAIGDGLEDESEKIKFGDGVTHWKDLKWWKGPRGENGNDVSTDLNYNPQSENAQSGKAIASALVNYLPLDVEYEWELDGGDSGANMDLKFIIDDEMSNVSNNAVQNKAVKDYIDKNLVSKNRRYIFIGDSYGDGWAPYQIGSITSWATILKNNMGLSDKDCYISTMGGSAFCKCDASGESGGKNLVSLNANTNKYCNFLDRLTELENTVVDKDSITDILVAGGYNEATAYEQDCLDNITYGIKYFMNYVKRTYPNAKVHIAFIAGRVVNCDHFNSASTYEGHINLDALPYYYIMGAKHGAAYVVNSEYIMHNSDLFWSDGIHPNSLGQDCIATQLTSYLSGGGVDVQYSTFSYSASEAINDAKADINAGQSIKLRLAHYSTINNNVVQLHFLPTSLPSPHVISLQRKNEIRDIVGLKYILGPKYVQTNCEIIIQTNHTYDFYNIPATIVSEDNKIYLYLNEVVNDNYATYENVSKIEIRATLTFPTLQA